MKYEREYSNIQYEQPKLYKDRINKKLAGVCAGIAKYYKCPSWAIRLATVVGFIMMPVVTLVAYIVASLLLPSRDYN